MLRGVADALDTAKKAAGGAAEAIAAVDDRAAELAATLQSNVAQGLGSLFAGLITGATTLKEAIGGVIARLGELALTRGFETLLAGIGFGTGPLGRIASLLFAPTPRAAGGPVMAGLPYLVGERGPELIVPRAPGRVIPNHVLGHALGHAPAARWRSPCRSPAPAAMPRSARWSRRGSRKGSAPTTRGSPTGWRGSAPIPASGGEPMAIAFPLARSVFADRLKIAAFRWQLLPFVEMSGTALGQVITNEIAPRRWRAEVELARMPHAEAADIQALIDALGPSGTFHLHNPAQLGPRDDPTGAGLAGHTVGINTVGSDNKSLRLERAAGRLHPAPRRHAALRLRLEPDPAGAAPHRRGRDRQRSPGITGFFEVRPFLKAGVTSGARRHAGPGRGPDDARARLVRPRHGRAGQHDGHVLQAR